MSYSRVFGLFACLPVCLALKGMFLSLFASHYTSHQLFFSLTAWLLCFPSRYLLLPLSVILHTLESFFFLFMKHTCRLPFSPFPYLTESENWGWVLKGRWKSPLRWRIWRARWCIWWNLIPQNFMAPRKFIIFSFSTHLKSLSKVHLYLLNLIWRRPSAQRCCQSRSSITKPLVKKSLLLSLVNFFTAGAFSLKWQVSYFSGS